VEHPKEVLKEGEVKTLRIIRIDSDQHRVGLSLRKVDSAAFADKDFKLLTQGFSDQDDEPEVEIEEAQEEAKKKRTERRNQRIKQSAPQGALFNFEPMPILVDAHADIAYNMLKYGRDYTRPIAETRRLEAGTHTVQDNGDTLISWHEYQRGNIAVIFATLFAARPLSHLRNRKTGLQKF
jgi:hypothetical protein